MDIIKNPNIIFDYIKQQNLTHRQFCKLCKVGYNTYICAISKRPVQDMVIARIARFMNVKFIELAKDVNAKYNKQVNCEVIKKFMQKNSLTKKQFCDLCAIKSTDFTYMHLNHCLEDAIIERISYFTNIKPEKLIIK